MPDPRHTLGIAAEDAVAAWLAGAGWSIIGRRVRSPGGGEVDLVALDPERILVAIEVRARQSGRAGMAAATVDAARIARLGRTLASVAATDRHPHRGLRVDVVSVMRADRPGHWRLERIPGGG